MTDKTKMEGQIRLLARAWEVFRDPKFRKANGLTWCNAATARVLALYGYTELNGLLSTAQHELIKGSKDWAAVSPAVAAVAAEYGGVCVGVWSAPPTGHIVIVLPGPMDWKEAWAGPAPRCLDIGANHTFWRTTAWAFHFEPEYYALRRTLPWSIP